MVETTNTSVSIHISDKYFDRKICCKGIIPGIEYNGTGYGVWCAENFSEYEKLYNLSRKMQFVQPLLNSMNQFRGDRFSFIENVCNVVETLIIPITLKEDMYDHPDKIYREMYDYYSKMNNKATR